MGFYGNITNATKTTLTFDKTFPNRKAMDDGLLQEGGDDIFIGRYVLVDYSMGSIGGNYTRVYQHGNYFYFSATIFGESDNSMVLQSEKPYYWTNPETGITEINPERKAQIYYVYDNKNNKLYETEDEDAANAYLESNEEATRIEIVNKYAGYIFMWEPVYTLNQKTGEISWWVCDGFQLYEDKAGTRRAASFTAMTEAPNDTDSYYTNFAIDRAAYQTNNNGIGRGYDSTVWQKVYTSDGEKYVMIAELNSVVPSFGITADPPSLEPLAPHFDADSTNVFYRLHVQPSWGFRVGKTEDLEAQPSDTHVNEVGARWDSNLKTIDWQYNYDYDGAIYYNKDGFDSAYRIEKENNIPDEIKVTPTGSSGYLYTDYHRGNTLGEPTAKKDIQELTINLPSLGNTMSQVWDMIYGTGELVAGSANKYKRNQNISWDNLSGLRMIREKDGTGFEYDPEQTETLAGAINSVHDLMGMIIIDEDPDIEDALINKIYYTDPTNSNKKGFYYKNLTYQYDKNQTPGKQIVSLKDFSLQDYYYKVGKNYCLEKNGYIRGNKYYTFLDGNIVEQPLTDITYKPNTFFYLDGQYKLDSADTPTENRIYYTIKENESPITVDFKNIMFFPTDINYYNQFINEGEGVENKDRKSLFYFDSEEGIYRPFKLGQEKTKDMEDKGLFLITGYTSAPKVEVATGEITQVYDFTNAIIPTKGIQLVDFAQNTYYYFNETTQIHEVLTSQSGINIKNTYTSGISYEKVLQGKEKFYEPNKYYYKEGSDFIFAKEPEKLSRSYYVLGQEVAAEGRFYEPNVYYYKDGDNDVIDTSSNMTADREYYLLSERYVMNDNDYIPKGSKWNSDILTIPEGIELGVRHETYEWKELTGFARTLNTIHGLILQINKVLKLGDKLTRDRSSVQGCINVINDIIAKFYALNPTDIMIVDQYGRLTGAQCTGDTWTSIKVNDKNPGISITHIGPAAQTARNEADLTPAFGNTFTIEDWGFDEKGHKASKGTHTVKIPGLEYKDDTTVNNDVVTNISYSYDNNNSKGVFTETRAQVGTLPLTNYSVQASAKVAKGDTINVAVGKLQGQIDGMDFTDPNSNTTQFISKIIETDGKISVERHNAGDLLLTGYTEAASPADVTASDSLNVGLGKLSKNINQEISNRKSAISNLKFDDEDNTTKFISKVTQSDGKISVFRSSADSLSVQGNGTGVTLGALKDTVDTLAGSEATTGSVKNQIKAINDTLASTKGALEAADTELQNSIEELSQKPCNNITTEDITNWDAAYNSKSTFEYNNSTDTLVNIIKSLNDRIIALEKKVTALENSTPSEG